MTDINQLSAVDSVTASDQVPIYSVSNGDARRVSFTAIATYIATLITPSTNKVTQYSAPSATGFTVVLTDNSTSRYLILTPVAGYAAGSITLPAVGNCIDKQEITVSSTQAVTTLTINLNGNTVNGAPTTLAANAFFTLRFDGVVKAWYRIG
jgi:hypothetical protein